MIDESGDIPLAVLKAGEQALGNCTFGKIMQAGNPTSHEGMLYLVATKLRHMWHIIRITGDPDDSKRSPRIDINWAREQIKLYGKDDPWVMAYILGQFPESSLNTLLSPHEVEEAMSRHMTDDKFDFAQKRLGVDCARFGLDKTVIFPRQGLCAFKPVELRNARSNEIAARVMSAKSKWGAEIEFIDDTGGYGSGVVDSLLQGGANPIAINFSERAGDPRYFNKRSEMWFKMAEWIKRGGKLPNVMELVGELTTPQYSFQNGKFRLEEKDRIKERLGRSPDFADALALTFAWEEMPKSLASLHPSLVKTHHAETEFDPYR